MRTRPGGGHGREADTVGRRTRPGGGRSPGRFVTGRLRPGETFDMFLAGCVSSRFRSVDLVAGCWRVRL